MGTITVTEFVTADGVVADPHLWSFPFWSENVAAFKNEEMYACDGLLLGRATYDGFAAAWPERKGTDEFADMFNEVVKYVVTTTLDKAEWENSTIIRSIDEVAKVKEDGGRLWVHGSAKLIQSLIAADLIDEYRLLVYPVVLGEGNRLFQDGTKAHLELIEVKDMGNGVIAQRYRRADAPEPVSYDDIMGKQNDAATD